MRIGILQCGEVPPGLEGAHGTYGAMVARLVEASGRCRIFDATQGVLPTSPTECDAYVLTGSPAGVYDADPWIGELIAFLRSARGKAKLVGICFGHQAMATAFGGKVVKSPKGWGIGIHRYDVATRAGWMDDVREVRAPASHQDQVVVAPPGARVTLASAFTPHAALDYGDAISFQFHPEFSSAFAIALLEARRPVFGDLTDPAIASYGRPGDCDPRDDRERVRAWIGRYLAAPPALRD